MLRALADPRREAIVDRFLEALGKAVEGLRVGDPLDEATQMGPLISAEQRPDTLALFVPDDAPVAIRGSSPDGSGYWFPPTVLAPVSTPTGLLAKRSGPVACVIPFADEGEAMRSRTTPSTAFRARSGPKTVPRRCELHGAWRPACSRSTPTRRFGSSTPFGGFKQSGVGRELGPDALEHYTEVKNVFYATEEE